MQVKQKGILIFKEVVTDIIHVDFKRTSRNNWGVCIHQLEQKGASAAQENKVNVGKLLRQKAQVRWLPSQSKTTLTLQKTLPT